MEEMHRTHKEPVWGWVTVVAAMIAQSRRDRTHRETRAVDSTTPRPVASPKSGFASVVTPWSPRSPSGWSA